MPSFKPLVPAALIWLAASPAIAAEPTITSFSPTQGPIGTSVTVTGTAFTGATSATIGGTAASYKVSSATSIIATLPATASGKIVIAAPGGTATSSTVFTVTPGAVVSPGQTHAGGAVTVTASGMDPYTSMDVFFDTTDVALTVSNGSGIASVNLAVPTNALPIKHWITFDERSDHKAVQAPVTINTNWPEGNYSYNAADYNPYEGALDNTSVPDLDPLWAKYNDFYANPLPMVESNGTIFVANTSGIAQAVSATGALVWTANFGGFVTNRNPLIYGSNVYFSNQTNVYAYSMTCGSKGATCKPIWTATVSSYSGGLTQYNGVLYIGGTDGNIHPINPATGALGTPFSIGGTGDGGITTPVVFSEDGGYAYGTMDFVHVNFGNGVEFIDEFSNSVGPIAFKGNLGYFETYDGVLHKVGGGGWTATLSGAGCVSTPAAAYGLVYAGDCNYVWGFNDANGSARWNFAGGYVSGISVANHIVYACADSAIVALNASDGSYLWTGGSCSSAPLVANGVVYGSDANIYAFTIPALAPGVIHRRPAVARLRRNWNLVAIPTPELSPLSP
jgi:hypothetical protein